jgi:hypothetical protein
VLKLRLMLLLLLLALRALSLRVGLSLRCVADGVLLRVCC